MRLKKGFTLIELLVVISIIAMLLAILMPALGAVKERARGVVCRANQHQWGLCYQLYAHEWDGKLPIFVGGTVNTTYVDTLRTYYDNINKMRTCPSATKVTTENPTNQQPLSFFGSTDSAWQIDPVAVWLDDKDWGIGSFCENSYIRENVANPSPKAWVTLTAMKRPSEVPLLGDGRWNNAWPEDNRLSEVGTELEFYNIGNWSSIAAYAMRRHSGGINLAMGDMSAIGVKVEELWSLKWHRTFKKTRENDLDVRWIIW